MKTNNKIQRFWNDFLALAPNITADPENDQAITYLDTLVQDLGDFDWEFGPSDKKEYYFCISPNLQASQISEADEIIALSPKNSEWEFVSGKPQKTEPITQWQMENERDLLITINTEGWKCVLYQFADKTYDIDIKISQIDGNKDTQILAIDIHLCNLLGEKKYLQLIQGISIVSEFSNNTATKAIWVKDIGKYL